MSYTHAIASDTCIQNDWMEIETFAEVTKNVSILLVEPILSCGILAYALCMLCNIYIQHIYSTVHTVLFVCM